MMLAWSAAVPQAVVLPALVLGSPGLVLLLVSVESVVQLVPVAAALSESLGSDHRSGDVGDCALPRCVAWPGVGF